MYISKMKQKTKVLYLMKCFFVFDKLMLILCFPNGIFGKSLSRMYIVYKKRNIMKMLQFKS